MENKINIEQNSCVKCGACVVSYPEIFEFDEKNNIRVKKDVDGSKEEYIDICPVGAIY